MTAKFAMSWSILKMNRSITGTTHNTQLKMFVRSWSILKVNLISNNGDKFGVEKLIVSQS